MAKVNLPSAIEPSYTKEEVATQLDVIQALNWYNANYTEKDAAKILGCEPKIAKNNTTYAWVTRMRTRGFKFSQKTEDSISNLKAAFNVYVAAKAPVVEVDADGNVVVAVSNVINMQERIATKTDSHIGELEGVLDEFGLGIKTFKAYDWFIKNEVKPVHAAKIIEYFTNRLSELQEAAKKFPEYYEDMPKAKMKSLIAVMTVIIDDAGRLSQNVNKTRKSRKKKPVSIEKQVAKLKFKQKDDNFKIQSIDPSNIIGADQLWVFNVKTRKLGVYIAVDRGGLKIKGSALLNYEETSISKTLRKPETVLSTILDGGKIVLRKVMDGINSKGVAMNGRINKDTILLRVVK
ncbi:hypothetical protein UFOVP49_100 [uncultured Caudovirales phage]|uniref:Uncharacterized protein n=1 Tax=uncultured Caudovirales phage TaxID=2100421 RepID=A0A6J5KSM9_9CAUD|nr:hypothetical protein UFOVP49_100 [uncultured Caudovirales phage]